MGWNLERHHGRASRLHADSASAAATPDAGRRVLLMEADGPAIVLGSAQPESHVDLAVARREGIEVARRRSGGGAVLVTQDTVLWVDVVIPSGDGLWESDVGKAAWWVGKTWKAALESLTVPGTIGVWKEGLQSTPWSSRVCFAGVGPGEVLVDGKKAVGVSQRRTRSGALFQTAVLLEWRPGDLVRVLALEPDARRRAEVELGTSAVGISRRPAELLDAFLAALPG